MSNFRVGQQVVCIEDKWIGQSPLRKGALYTITDITGPRPSWSFNGFGKRCDLILAEAQNTSSRYGGFNPDRFRPVVERKTNISVFKAMLNPSKQEKQDA